jgi:hypothetical protein
MGVVMVGQFTLVVIVMGATGTRLKIPGLVIHYYSFKSYLQIK